MELLLSQFKPMVRVEKAILRLKQRPVLIPLVAIADFRGLPVAVQHPTQFRPLQEHQQLYHQQAHHQAPQPLKGKQLRLHLLPLLKRLRI